MKTIVARSLVVVSLLLVAACGSSSTGGSTSSSGAFVVTTDFSTGSFSVVAADRSVTPGVGSIHSDAAAFAHDGRVYVVNRLGADNLQVIDPAAGYATVAQYSLGASSNPHEIAFASATKAYVTRYGTGDVAVIDPSTGDTAATIDLAPYADADGSAEGSQMRLVGDRLYVMLQNIDQNNYWVPAGTSRMVTVDTDSDTVVADTPLPLQNPTGAIVDVTGSVVAIVCIGNYGVADGGVVLLDTATGTVSAGALTEALAGGDLYHVVYTSATTGYAIVGDSSYNTLLKSFDTAAGTVATVHETVGFKLAGMTLHDGELWLVDRTTEASGVLIFDAATGDRTAGPLSTGLPPQQILFP